MNTDKLREWATDKDRFLTIDDFVTFGRLFLDYRSADNFQAELVARNNPQYRFFQYKDDADFQLTRPINTELFYAAGQFDSAVTDFYAVLDSVVDGNSPTADQREALTRVIYSCQQSIGASLDSLPARQSNTARKINGDLFERFIGLTIERCGIDCRSGVVKVPVTDDGGKELFKMNYQHDLMVEVEGELKAIGSVKTSSKDRMDKVFVDKFLYNRLTGVPTPHFAIFLHDVQRKGKQPNYGTSNTFLPGHFKAYTVKLNPLDGVYYCDLLPNMKTDPLLAENISRIDQFYVEDLPTFVREAPHVDADLKAKPIIEATD